MGINILSAGTDLNNILVSGTYRLQDAHVNIPDTDVSYGNMLVMRVGDTATQIITDYTSNRFYWRSGQQHMDGGIGVWHPWRKVWHAGNFNPDNYLNKNTTNYAPVGGTYISYENIGIGIKIRLPFSVQSDKMVCFTVRLYSDYNAYDIQFSGYLYKTSGSWYNPKAATISITGIIIARMGVDADGIAYVWLTGGAWVGVSVLDITGGYNYADWNSGWEIIRTDDCPNVVLEKTLYPNADTNQLNLKV